jgi:hypothetical protein
MTFLEFNEKFKTEQAAIDYFYKVRYNFMMESLKRVVMDSELLKMA